MTGNNQLAQQARVNKQKHMQVFKNALKIGESHKFGEAFDQELQEKKRLEKLAEKKEKQKEYERQKKLMKAQQEKETMLKEIEQIKQREE
jgi:hypothetical protein